MQELIVDLKDRSYPIYTGSNLPAAEFIRKALPKVNDAVVVSNDTVAPLYYEKLRQALAEEGFKVSLCMLPDGEQYKTAQSYMQILTHCLKQSLGRDGALIALGGGVVGDLTGFAASTYQRGIAYVQVPTTLLAMVDSSVGGKTAINHELGKNMIGTFYQPRCVCADIEALKTLPPREISAGLAEVVKYGIIYDRKFFDYLYEKKDSLMHPDAEICSYMVNRCCEIKALVVAQDEQEHGLRAILNLGHTFGHAIESYMGFGTLLHGEAVAIGMALACRYACRQGALSEDELELILELLQACSLSTDVPRGMKPQDFIERMHHDKKVREGQIVYVIPTALGACKTVKLGDDAMEEFLREYCA